MARMLGVSERPWCPVCRGPAGLDCPDSSRSKKAARAGEKRATRREVEAVLAEEFAPFADEAVELAEAGLPAFAETLRRVPWWLARRVRHAGAPAEGPSDPRRGFCR